MPNTATTAQAVPPPTAHSRRFGEPSSIAVAGLLALPAALVVWSSFQSGGFFAGTPALLAAIVGILLMLRVTLADRPFAGFGPALALAAGALGLFAVWTLVSAMWSNAPGRALVEFDRVLLYWLVLVLFGSLAALRGRLEWALRGVAVAAVAVCAAALVSKLFPDLVDVALPRRRLNWPLTYWNALGLLAAIGAVLCAHLASSEREPAAARVFGAAALPVLATTLLLTFSRGAMGVAVVGVLVYAIAARPRGLPAALLAVGAPVAVALITAYGAELLTGPRPTGAAAAGEGQDVFVTVALCVVAAGLLRGLLLPLDARLSEYRVTDARRRRSLALAGGAAALALVAGAVALGVVGFVTDRAEGFFEADSPRSGDVRDRLTNPSNNGRVEQWQVALDGFAEKPLTGHGAGEFAKLWAAERDVDLKVEDAHSLYLEAMAELGIVGLVLILVAIGAILVAVALRTRGAQRHLYAAVLAAGLAWAVHAGIDWDWEMPAITVWLFALGGLAIARPPGARSAAARPPGTMTRVTIGVACLALIVTPVLMAVSQRALNASVTALKEGDCRAAVDHALAAAEALSARPEPFEVLGYCDARLGQRELAVEMLEAAVRRDPGSWRLYYGLALVRAAAGLDPRPAAARALELNPRDPLARDGVRRFRTGDPQKWERRAASARLPVL